MLSIDSHSEVVRTSVTDEHQVTSSKQIVGELCERVSATLQAVALDPMLSPVARNQALKEPEQTPWPDRSVKSTRPDLF